MSITDELRGYAKQLDFLFDNLGMVCGRLLDIADRIDAEHEVTERQRESYRVDLKAANGAVNEAYNRGYDEGFASADDWLGQHEDAMSEHGWVRLPVDADGEVIHVGDTLVSRYEGRDYVREVEALIFTDRWDFELSDEDGDTRDVASMEDFYSNTRHYHAPTVEDVLREFGDWYAHVKGGCDEDGIIAEYAAKVREVVDA